MSESAELFALVHTGTTGDIDFYRDVCQGSEHTLELGCGHGRVLTQLARGSALTIGLDHDAGLLALAADALEREGLSNRTIVGLIQADMRSFRLRQRFERIVIPYNGLYTLPSEQAQTQCLAQACAHLAENGLLIWDAYVIDEFHHGMRPEDIDINDDEPIDTIEWRGHGYLVFEHSAWTKDAQQIDVRYRYLPLDSGQAVQEQTIRHRYLLTTQLDALCHAAGLELIERFSDFHGTPLSKHSEHMVCMARRRRDER